MRNIHGIPMPVTPREKLVSALTVMLLLGFTVSFWIAVLYMISWLIIQL